MSGEGYPFLTDTFRNLADVWWVDGDGQEHHVNQDLLTLELAVAR